MENSFASLLEHGTGSAAASKDNRATDERELMKKRMRNERVQPIKNDRKKETASEPSKPAISI